MFVVCFIMINGTGDSAYCAILVFTFICNHFTGKGTVPHSRLFMIGLFAYGGILLLLPGKEPDSLIECIWFRLKNSAQCRATQQVFYELFTFKIIPNLQLKLCTLYVHFLSVLYFESFDCICRCCISWKLIPVSDGLEQWLSVGIRAWSFLVEAFFTSGLAVIWHQILLSICR